MCKYAILIIVAHLVILPAFAVQQPSVSDLLAKYRMTQDSLQSFVAESVDTTTSTDSANPGSVRLNRETSEFRFDGDRVDFLTHMWSDLYASDQPTPIEKAAYRNFIWDSESFFQYKRDNKVANTDWAFRSTSRHRIPNLISVAYRGAPLMGIFFGDDKRVDSILQQADTMSLRNNMEVVGGSDCYIIDAVTQYGKYAVWIDPQHGYNIAKAEVQKKGTDLAWSDNPLNGREKQPQGKRIYVGSNPPPTEKKALSFSIENVRFEKVNNVWVPMEADYQYIKTYQGNRAITVKRHHKRTKIDLEPDFETLGAFVPDIPEGTKVLLEGVPGIEYEWFNGKARAKIDDLVIDYMDDQIEQMKYEADVKPPVATEQRLVTSHDEPIDIVDAQPDVEIDVPGTQKRILSESDSFPALRVILVALLIVAVIGWLAFHRFKTQEKRNGGM